MPPSTAGAETMSKFSMLALALHDRTFDAQTTITKFGAIIHHIHEEGSFRG